MIEETGCLHKRFSALLENKIPWKGMIVFLLLLGVTNVGLGQKITKLKGSVKSQSGESLPGVSVILKGSYRGTVSDFEGHFVLENIPAGEQLVQASFLGYETFELALTLKPGDDNKCQIVLRNKSFEISGVEVRGKSVASQINEQAYSVTSVSVKALLNSSANVKEVLNKVPGVRIMEEGGLGSDINFTINGFSGNQVKFFMDGLPMDNFGSSLSFGDIPVNMIERIDVYNGVVPVWLGTDALGGAVNIITNKKNNFLDFSYSFGSFNTHKASVNFAQTNKESGFTIRGNAFVNYSDNNYKVWVPITNGDNLLVDTVNTKRFHDRYRSGTLKLEAGLVNKTYADNLLFGLMLTGNDKQLQHGATMATVYGGIVKNSKSLIPTFRYNKKDVFTEGLDLSLYTAFNVSKAQVIDTLKGIRYNWLGEAFKSDSEDGELSSTYTTFDEKEFLSQFNAGYEINTMHSFAFNYSYTYFDREVFDRENPDNVPNQFSKSLNKHVIGLAYKWDKNQKWSTTVFGKFYLLNAKTSNLVDFGLETQRTLAVESSNENIGYGLATSYFLIPKLQLKASYEHTYRMPTPLEIFGDGLFVDPNSDIGPEQSDNLNAGADYRFKFGRFNQINLGSTFIYRESKDLIYTVVKVSSPVTYYDNLSKTRTLGVEANFQYQWKDIFHFGGNVTYQDITDQAKHVYNESYTGTGWQKNFHYAYRLPNKPYLFGSANVGLNFNRLGLQNDVVSINYHFNYVENYFLTWSENEKYIIPQQISHDVELSYAFKNGKYNISAECRNLLDTRLYDKYYLQKPGRFFSVKLRYTL